MVKWSHYKFKILNKILKIKKLKKKVLQLAL
jgi:hypothetical protein